MKEKAGLIVPILLMLFGVYALITTFGDSGEQVTLFHDHLIPRGLALMFGIIGLGGGIVIMLTSLSKRKSLS